MGYTPIFNSLTTGTLCGKWPDVGLWPIVLSLADRLGVIDVTPDYLARVTGLPVDDVTACMKRLCEPDPCSRSTAQNGARLVLVDPTHRDWGWRVVNHSHYREKARLAAKASREIAEGKNKSRMQDRRSPPVTAGDPLSNSYQTKTEDTEKRGVRGEKSSAPSRDPPFDPSTVDNLDRGALALWLDYRQRVRKPLKPVSIPKAAEKLALFGAKQRAVVEQSIANGWTGLFELKADGKSAPIQERWE